MKIRIIIAFASLFSFREMYSNSIFPENPKKKKLNNETGLTNIEFGGGIMGSVLYLARNVKDKNDAYGYSFSANYGGTNLLRVGIQYTYYTPINIAPTWYDVKATSIEVNLELIARFRNNKSFLYPFVGLSYNTFSGYFTGLNDFLNLKEYYKPNSTIQNSWIGLNIGTGFEHAFGPVVLFIDYRMRIGTMERNNTFNIMDVCYGGGIRVKLVVPTFKKIYKGLKDRYNVG